MIQTDDMGWEVEGGFRIGNSRVHPWLIHINVLQNQYSIVKQNEVKIKIKKKEKRKSRGTRDQIANICWIIKKASPEKHLLLLY